MTNDLLTQFLFGACGDNLPHAPIEWISKKSICLALTGLLLDILLKLSCVKDLRTVDETLFNNLVSMWL